MRDTANYAFAFYTASTITEPQSYQESMESPDVGE